VENFNEVWAVSEVSGWFPTVVARIIPSPLDKVLVLIAVLSTVKNAFNFIFILSVDQDRRWRWGIIAVDVIA